MKIKPTAEDKLIEYYRYFSLSLTSLMYLLDKTGPSVIYKSLVIAILFLFAQTFSFFIGGYEAGQRLSSWLLV